MLFGEEEHHAQVADAFFGKVGGGDEFHAFELTEVGGVACRYRILWEHILLEGGEQFTRIARHFEKRTQEICCVPKIYQPSSTKNQCSLTQHMHKQQLRHIPMPIMLLLLSNRRTYHCGFLRYDGTLFGSRFTGADLPDEIAEFE